MITLPESYKSHVYWVNGTCHLSSEAAKLHQSLLTRVNDMEGFRLAARAIDGTADLDRVLSYFKRINYDFAKARDLIAESPRDARIRLKLARERLMRKVEEWRIDPTLGDKVDLQAQLNELLAWSSDISNPVLSAYERKSALKYAGNQNIRNFETYYKNFKDYLPEREWYSNLKLPSMEAYDRAITRQYDMFRCQQPSDIDDRYRAAINSTQRNTFGGSPFYVAMDTFLDPDADDDITMVKLYDLYAMIYFLLPPRYKISLARRYQYTALERVQHGGLEDSDVFKPHKPNKQRIVQAESAVISHATKQMHDIMLDEWKKHIPLAADKYGEDRVTECMKEIYYNGLKYHDTHRNEKLLLMGLDWASFDSCITPTLLNDAYFNVVRMHVPAWYVYWIVDPYFTLSLNTPIFVPGHGLRITTGVKSGQQITNQGDCFCANFADLYELERAMMDGNISKPLFDLCLRNRMINGDDRYKLGCYSAAQVERYNAELALIAQKEKQEIYDYNNHESTLQVTYLKTMLFIDTKTNTPIRTSSVTADILGRYTRERFRRDAMPATVVMELLMAGNRLSDHPDIRPIITAIQRIPIGAQWLNNEISTKVLMDLAAIEQLTELIQTKGKRWLERMHIDAEEALQRLYHRYGMTPGNYNFQADYAGLDGKLKFEALPLVARVLKEARS